MKLTGLLIFLFSTLNLVATSYAPPKEQDIFSENKKFVLHINPETEIHSVYDTIDRSKELWSFSKGVWLEPCFLSNDGKSVIMVSWRYVRAGDIKRSTAVYFFSQEGLSKEHSLKDICSYPSRFPKGPIGSFWRCWYRNIQYKAGDILEIHTTGMYHYKFSLRDGSIIKKEFKFQNISHKWFEIIRGLIIIGAILFWVRKKKQ